MALGAALAAVQYAAAGPRLATPADNHNIEIEQGALLGVHIAGFVAGFAPVWFGTPGEVVALGSDIAIKHTPPTLHLPNNKAWDPNSTATGSNSAVSCVYRFRDTLPTNDGYANGVREEAQSIFGLVFDPVAPVWGDLGEPRVYHPQADFAVSVANEYLGQDAYRPLPSTMRAGLEKRPELPEGLHEVDWAASTSINEVLDIALPSVLIPAFAFAEYKLAQRLTAKNIAKITRVGATAGREAALKAATRAAELKAHWIFKAVDTATEAGLLGAEQGLNSVEAANQWFDSHSFVTAINRGTQTITVWDNTLPRIRDTAPSGAGDIALQDIALEAADFGGVRFGRVQDALRARFEPVDDCGKEFIVTADMLPSQLIRAGETTTVTWSAREIDGGPYRAGLTLRSNQTRDGDRITTTLEQRITVEDTQPPILVPPPGFARESSTPVSLASGELVLGRPLVSDLADPNPRVEIVDKPDQLEPDQRYAIEYKATDASDNTTVAPADDLDRYRQIVTIKTPNTNTPPESHGATAATVSARPVTITLTGTDHDVLGGPNLPEIPDPLEFKIVEPPGDGEFVAPLYPFFIEDLRAKPAGDPGSADPATLACPVDRSSGEQLSAMLGLVAPPVRHEYVAKCYCAPPPSLGIFAAAPPRDFIYSPTYIHISDEGEHFVSDRYWQCDNDGAPFTDDRIAKFVDGVLIGQTDADGFEGVFQIDDSGNLWTISMSGGGSSNVMTVSGYDGDTLQPLPPPNRGMQYHGTTVLPATGMQINAATLVNAHVDIAREVVYVNDKLRIWMFDYNAPTKLLGPLTGATFLESCESGAAGSSRGGFWMDTDSDGNLYQVCGSRVHKFGPPSLVDGVRQPGRYLGWLGKCTGNLATSEGVPYNFCDVATQTSKGFQCTDETCARSTVTAENMGSNRGQFNSARHITVGPGDVLYVVDYNNFRVQRFAPDGTFAGEAKSTGGGVTEDVSFVLGNMGRPRHVSVNSSEFHVLEWNDANADYFLHVFKTLPFYDVTKSSAKVDYVSDLNFQGLDTFTYLVDDGIAASSEATVSVNVSRAFRAPENLRVECYTNGGYLDEKPCTLDEDTDLYLRVVADDPDGFIDGGGLDRLTFNVLEPPAHGALLLLSTTDNAAKYRYRPDASFNGSDAFSFDAFDGVLTSFEPKVAGITVMPIPDPVAIRFPDEALRAARGFPRAFTADYSDVDQDGASDPKLTTLAWGDGVTASGPAWAGSGRTDPNGREIGPQAPLGVAAGIIVGSHTYMSAGNRSLQITMSNAAESLPNTVAAANVEVIEATMVGARMAEPSESVQPDTQFDLVLEVTNSEPEEPDVWPGLTARSAGVSITVPPGLTIVEVDGSRCVNGAPIVCTLGDLDPGETVRLEFQALIDLDAARNETDYDLQLELVDDGPKLRQKTISVATVEIADRDDDGVMDLDDAFPDDPRYSDDADGDGLADEWELAYGFDPTVADDPAFDDDSDGFTAMQEFENGSFPFLQEQETERAGARLAATGAAEEDQFGIAIAGGDLNEDGYDDTVIGAPGHNGGAGSVFIAYGGADGASTTLVRLAPAAGMTRFGRSIAVADFDGNGYPDLAVGGANAVAIHLNNGEILSLADHVLNAGTANFGSALGAGDLDADGAADLVVGANNAVAVYFSRRGFDEPPVATLLDGTADVSSAAVADLDGDGAADLVLGTPGKVYGFRAVHADWPNAPSLNWSFLLTLAGGDTFGHSVASGDIRGDGIEDLVVGAYTGGGQVLVYDSGTAYWNAPTIGGTSTVPPAQVIAGAAAGAGDSFGDQLGVRVAVGRLNADAFADVVAGGNRAGVRDAGQIRIFRGSPAGLVASSPQVELGAADFDLLGHYVAIPGDVDGNGFADVAAGASRTVTTQNPTPSRGYVQIFQHTFVATNPAQDLDNDGVRAVVDNCELVANTDQADLDGDGLGDVCDIDSDGDGLLNDTDNCPLLASIDQTNTDLDSFGDLCDGDDDNDDVLDGDDRFPNDARYNADTDEDGLPDEYETEHGLSPTSAADALLDLDGDGRSNVDEFLAGTNVAADDVPPVLSAPAAVVVSSIGAYTAVALGAATATDAKDGALTALPSDPGPFRPGRHSIEWHASDAAGNEGVALQQVDVIPRVDFLGETQYTAEGAVAAVTARLNGPAVTYPVSVPYTLAGTATNGADYFLSGVLEIAGGNPASLELVIATDSVAEGEETVVVKMGVPVNAVAGDTAEHVVRIVETNLAPRVALRVEQAGEARSILVATGGPVMMTAAVDDPNPGDALAIDWGETHPALVPAEGFAAETFTFDPAAAGPGVFVVRVRATDAGGSAGSAARLIRVVASPPAFVPGADSDGDGVEDAAEGFADGNENGVSNYLEATKERNVLTAVTGERRVLQTRAGLALTLGRAALASGADAAVTLGDVASFGDDGGPALNAADDAFSYPTGLYDFEVHGLAAAGDSAQVVLALPARLPASAAYRKYVSPHGWGDFVVNAANAIASAPGALAACPAPGSSAYTPGLGAGHFCVQLTIEDGGPNDADGAANGVIRDPGGVAVSSRPATVVVTALTAASRTVNAGATNVVALRFRLSSDSADVVLSRLSLAASGTGNDASDVRAVKLWIDANGNGAVDGGDTQVGSGAYPSDNGTLQLVLAAPYALPFGDTQLLVTYDL